jgi:hypothetical protein
MRSFLVVLAVAGALLACRSVNDVAAGAKASLDRHQAQWGQRTFTSYSFGLVQQKFGGTSIVHVTVNEQYGYPTLLEITSRTPAGPFSAQLSNLTPAA